MEHERFITPWMKAHGFDLSTPESVMSVAGDPSDIAYAKAIGVWVEPAQPTVLAPGTPEWWAQAADLPAEILEIGLKAQAGGADMTTKIAMAGLPALPVAAGLPALLAGVGLPAGLAGIAGGLYGLAQLFGLGEGGGLFGLNILGGDVATVDNIQLGGPGVLEPTPANIRKQWNTPYADFWQVQDGRIVVRSKKTNQYKVYRPAKHIVIPKNPRVGTLLKGAKRIDNLMLGIDRRMSKFRKRTRGRTGGTYPRYYPHYHRRGK